MVTNFTPLTLLVGVVVAAIGAVLYFFIDRSPAMKKKEKMHQEFLNELRHNEIKF